MVLKCVAVGLGGFVGAISRYLISKIEFVKTGNYPINTLLVNILGAVLIGIIISYANQYGMNEEKLLFLKVGLCGGLTTFSTFSVETVGLLESGNILAGIGYILLSVILCILGVFLGLKIG